jgi:predicted acylesterase/phospholipase RssA
MTQGQSAHLFTRAAAAVAMVIALAACSTLGRNAVPESARLSDVLAGPGPVRIWGDMVPKDMEALARQRDAQYRAAGIDPSGVMNYLAISGGGSDGAFGAGLLVGWSEAGTRPKFDVVTGVSTGALIAPLAFLGSAYDSQLKEIYTSYGLKEIAQRRPLISIAAEASVADNAPMARLIARYVTGDFLDRIAGEHRKGRRLLIGTTHLDAQRPVIWNMGEIATRGDQKATELFRTIMLASAAIPGVFPPVLISVEQDGKAFDEMHVDGGVASQVFIFPAQFDARSVDRRLGRSPTRRLFVIRNGRLNPEWETVEPRLLKIAGRSISSLIKYQGRGDLDRMYLQSRNYGADFSLASIPSSFSDREKEPFDLEYMNALFDVGYDLGRRGYRWQKRPPDFL